MLLIIGLDGADWNILNPWIEGGHLPHLAELRARGTWGALRSTIRPESSTAWSTFATGVNPARHGIFGFSGQRPDSYETTLNTAANVRYPTFWRRAGAAGKRVALLNVPMTYPPQPFENGALVAGMLTPSVRSEFTHPPDLRQRLLAAVPDYAINVERTGLKLQRFIRETTKAIEARGRAALWLLGQEAWDALAVVFTASDRLQHHTLHLLAPDHPRHDPAAAARLLPDLLAAYQALDDAVGELIAAAGPDATVLVLSDHGFAPCARAFYPNVWLEGRGLLVRQAPASRPGLWRRLRRSPGLRRMKNALPFLRDWRRPPPSGSHLGRVDWSRTSAVYSPGGGIRFNVRGREPEGVLSPEAAARLGEELAGELAALVDPATGAAPLSAIYRRDDLYSGPHLPLAPDLILEPRRADADPARNTICAYGFGPDVLADSGELTGNHTLDGIFMAAGPGIAVKPLSDARLLDLAPTILHALSLPLPSDLDGRVLPLWAEDRTIVWDEEDGDSPQKTDPAQPFAADEEAAVEARLRALGYL